MFQIFRYVQFSGCARRSPTSTLKATTHSSKSFSLLASNARNNLASIRFPRRLNVGGAIWGTGLCCSSTQNLDVADVVHNVQAQLLAQPDASENALLEGTGTHLGLPIKWTLTLGPNGAFKEQFKGDKISCSWGSSGIPSPRCWEMDYSGVTRLLELDDHESCLLTTWIRSGQWLQPSVLETLDVQLLDARNSMYKCSSKNNEPKNAVPVARKTDLVDHNKAIDVTSHHNRASSSTLDLSIKLKSGKVTISVRVDRKSWLPVEMSQDLFGDRETWEFHDWIVWGETGMRYPAKIVHIASSGGCHEYATISARSRTDLVENSTETSTHHPPKLSLVPSNYEFNTATSNLIPAWKTRSCHVLVKPLVNGKDIGYMILDTGASGLVIEKQAADSLDLDKFGELFVSGVSGKVAAQFRRASSFTIGPLTIKDPQFMEMPVPGLVAGECTPVVGIIGYDIFRRSVVEMKPIFGRERQPPSKAEPNFDVRLHDLERFHEIPQYKNVKWFDLHLITNLPHIRAQFSTDGTTVHDALFMVDTGAGGAQVMFMSRAVDEFRLQNGFKSASKTFVKGVGGTQTERLPVKNGTLSWFKFQDKKLDDISCLFIDGSKMDISVYASGILCMNLLQDKETQSDSSESAS